MFIAPNVTIEEVVSIDEEDVSILNWNLVQNSDVRNEVQLDRIQMDHLKSSYDQKSND